MTNYESRMFSETTKKHKNLCFHFALIVQHHHFSFQANESKINFYLESSRVHRIVTNKYLKDE